MGPKFEKPDVSDQAGMERGGEPPDRGRDPARQRLVDACSATRCSTGWSGIAFRQNLPLQIAGLRIFEARAQLADAVGQQFPQVQVLMGDATAVQQSENTPSGAAFDRRYVDYQLGFDAAWEADFWGKFRYEVQAQSANLYATAADYDNALVSLTAEVARTYTMIRTFEVLIAQARQNVQVQEDGLQDRGDAVPQRRHVGAGRDPGHHLARGHPEDHPAARNQPGPGA